jgi:hypothetical protein
MSARTDRGDDPEETGEPLSDPHRPPGGTVNGVGATGERAGWAGDDESLADRLAQLFREVDAPPPAVVELARLSFGLRSLDAELATLTADSLVDPLSSTVRAGGPDSGPRLLTFETADLAVELEVSGSGRRRRLLGQLLPPEPARIEVRQPSAPDLRWVDADERGRFVVESVDPGPVSLTCHRPGRRPIATEWTTVD